MNEKMEAMYSLQEIAGCAETGRCLNLPQIQRGLVWKAAQIELLWDSILRGFPIGSFVVAEFSDNAQESAMQLLDGQQRMNAIKLGYNKFRQGSDGNQAPVLWFDLNPEDSELSSRRYWARVCTPAHPWGYKANDNCEVLNSKAKRDACERYEASDHYKPRTYEAWPHDSVCPIPFVYLVKAAESSKCKDGFVDNVIKQIGDESFLKPLGRWHSEFGKLAQHILNQSRGDLFQVFKRLQSYRVSSVALPDGFLTESTGTDLLGSMECFFERMNTGGTQISQEDLFYSSVKANFKGLDLKTHCDKLAETVMPPSHLAVLSFRLALTQGGSERLKLHGRPSLNVIRKIARETNSDEYKAIAALWKNSGKSIDRNLETVRQWISYEKKENQKGLLPVLRLSIILGSSDVFLLLLWLARNDEKVGIMDAKLALQLATLLHWFASDKYKACNAIMKECDLNGVSKAAIQRGVAFSINKSYLIEPYSPNILEEESRWNWSENWVWWSAWGETTPYYWDWINKIKSDQEMLLFAQRDYLYEKFLEYNPADKVLFGESNRPWDLDHIIPQDWMNNKRNANWLRFCQEWRDTNGNFAAIPFETNRAKSNLNDWNEYSVHTEGLIFGGHLEALHSNPPSITNKLCSNESMATLFAALTKDRMIKVYKEWYVGLKLKELLEFKENIPKPLLRRKVLFEELKQDLGEDADIYFVHGNDQYHATTEAQYCSDWLTVGVPIGKSMPSITIGDLGDDGFVQLEIGVRKKPGEKQLDEKYRTAEFKRLAEEDKSVELCAGGWWYLCHGERISIAQIDANWPSYIAKIIGYMKVLKNSVNS